MVAACPAEGQVTFSRDVAPIIFEHCTACHRAGEIGPFPLTSYLDVRQRASQIVDVTTRRVMPPWKPRGEASQFVGARRADRRANRDDSRLGGARRRRRQSRRPAAVARMAHRMAARHSGCRRPDAASRTRCGPTAPTSSGRSSCRFRPTAHATCAPSSSIPGTPAPFTTRTSGSIARARSRHLDGLDAETWLRGRHGAGRRVPAGPHARVDARSASAAVTRRRGVAPGAGQRRRRPAAYAADGQARTGAGERRAVLHRSRCRTRTPVGIRLGQPDDRHRRGQRVVRRHRQLPAAG